MTDRRTRADFTWRGFRAGIAESALLAANSGVGGVIFGVLAVQAGFDLVVAAAMSTLVFAGAAQVASLQIWANPIPIFAVWATTFAVNARYILLSASLRPWVGGGERARTYGTLFTLSDGGWALALNRWQNGTADGAYLLALGLAQYVTWVGGTVAGHVLGNRIGSPAIFGLDFIMPAFFAAMASGLWKRRSDLGPIAVGAGVALLFDRFVPGDWGILAGAMAGSLVGAFAYDRKS